MYYVVCIYVCHEAIDRLCRSLVLWQACPNLSGYRHVNKVSHSHICTTLSVYTLVYYVVAKGIPQKINTHKKPHKKNKQLHLLFILIFVLIST